MPEIDLETYPNEHVRSFAAEVGVTSVVAAVPLVVGRDDMVLLRLLHKIRRIQPDVRKLLEDYGRAGVAPDYLIVGPGSDAVHGVSVDYPKED